MMPHVSDRHMTPPTEMSEMTDRASVTNMTSTTDTTDTTDTSAMTDKTDLTRPYRTSPLAHRTPLEGEGGEVALAEIAHRGLVIIRGAPDDVATALEDVLGIAAPAGPPTSAADERARIVWLGPDQWLLIISSGDAADIAGKLSGALEGRHHQVVDVSSYYTTIEIKGARARDLLAKVAIIDLHPRAFRPGDAVASVFAKANGWLILREEPEGGGNEAAGAPAFELITRRSHADYLWCLLAEAGREWGLAPQEPIGRVPLHLPHFSEI